MNRDYEKAMMLVIRFKPDFAEFFHDAEKFELMQVKQFTSFANYLFKNVKDKDYTTSMDDFLKTNNYINAIGKRDLKAMFDQLNDGLDDFDIWSSLFSKRFYEVLNQVLKTSGFFSSPMNEKLGDEFLDGVLGLNAIRIKCLCYIALGCAMKDQLSIIPKSIFIGILKQEYETETSDIPDVFNSIRYLEPFYRSVFIYSK